MILNRYTRLNNKKPFTFTYMKEIAYIKAYCLFLMVKTRSSLFNRQWGRKSCFNFSPQNSQKFIKTIIFS